MIVVCCDLVRSTQTRYDVEKSKFNAGRSPNCDLELDSPLVSSVVLEFERDAEGWLMKAVGSNEVEIEGVDEPLEFEVPFRLTPRVWRVKINPVFDVVVEIPQDAVLTREERVRALNERLAFLANSIHREILERMDLGTEENSNESLDEQRVFDVEKDVEEIARASDIFSDENKDLAEYISGLAVCDELLSKAIMESGSSTLAANDAFLGDRKVDFSRMLTATPGTEDELRETCKNVERRLGVGPKTSLEARVTAIDKGFWDVWNDALSNRAIRLEFCNYLTLRYLKKTLKDILFGYGPLEDLLRMPVISEIMVVRYDTIFIEKMGQLENSGRRFFTDEATRTVINRIVAKVNRRIDASQPLVDARLVDGSRVNAIIAPIAVSGSCLTIRRFPQDRLTIQKLLTPDEKTGCSSLTKPAAEFLKAAVLARKNILVSGGTGTGKTTLLNCLCEFIPYNERIVTIEDVAELQIKKEHVVRLEAKAANVEGKGAYTIRDLVKNALRMRPDRIVVGECRGGEALDMLQAMNTGHDGSLTTIHANAAADSLLRLEVLVQMAADLPISSIHNQIVSAIDIIVQLKRMRNGRRCVSQIAEVTRIDPDTREIIIRDLFVLDSRSDDNAKLTPTGSLPGFMDVLIDRKFLDLEKFYF